MQANDCIAIVSHANWETICLLFAAWRLSLVVALIPPHYVHIPLSSIPYRLFVDDPAFIFATSSDDAHDLELSSLALLLLTSGSSGTSKWAAFTLSQLFESAEIVAEALSIQPNDRYLLSLPIHHVGGLGVILRSLWRGASITFENKSLPFPERIISAKAAFASLVPTQLFRLLQTDFSTIPTQLIIGGAGMSQNLYNRAILKGLHLTLTYGLTEMSSTVLLTKQPTWINDLPFLGFPLKGREIKISNEPIAKLPFESKSALASNLDHEASFAIGLNGEILVRGPCLFSGYGFPPIRSTNDWFYTADLGTSHEKHGFAIIGRKDFQFISGGENIQPEAIEAVILSMDHVEQAIVVPHFDDEYGARPVALIQSTESYETLLSQLTNRLPKHLIPIAFAELPRNATLKPNRKQLTDLVNKNYHCKGFVRLYR